MQEMLLHGSLRQLDSKKTAKRPLDIYIFNVQWLENDPFNSHYEQLLYLEKLGFNVNPIKKKCVRNRRSNKGNTKYWRKKSETRFWDRWSSYQGR